jgi:hypothetical protein
MRANLGMIRANRNRSRRMAAAGKFMSCKETYRNRLRITVPPIWNQARTLT